MHPDRFAAIGTVVVALVCTLVTACGGELSGIPSIENVTVYGPPPASKASVAYFEIHNPGERSIVLSKVSSPQYGQVEIHETRMDGDSGIARMRRLASVTIEPGNRAAFLAGGRHLMLMQPYKRLAAGSPLTLEFQFANGSGIVVSAVLQNRTIQ